MIFTEEGKPLDLEAIVEFEGERYRVQDTVGDTVVLVSVEGKLRKRLTAKELGMTSDAGDEKRKMIIRAKLRLREYWED